MKKAVWLWVGLCLWGGAAIAEDLKGLPVRVVGLFTSGVGYFQHAGTVSGAGRVSLSFHDNQINDLLKSLVVEDLSGALPDPVVYPSRDPQARLLERFHVKLAGNPPLAEVLRQWRGAQVRLHYQGETLTGTVLGVEQRPLSFGKKAVTDWVINLVTEQGVRVVPIKDMGRLELMDALLRDDLQQALNILRQGGDQHQKTVVLRFPGAHERQVRVGYVVETPVWKTSYRLIFPEEGTTARLQGWAIVENQSSQDWTGVRLFLVSGQPLSFIQNLYEPHYVTRPEVAVGQHPRIAPPRYQAGLAAEHSNGARMPSIRSRGMSLHARAGESQPERMADAESQETSWETQALRPAGLATTAAKVGALFQFVVDDVDLPQQRGAMIPIIADAVGVEKVSIYNASVLKQHPLAGVLLKNSTGKHLPAGPVTLFQGGFYGGDARLEDLPAGQERLLSYAVDQEVQVLGPTKQTESFMTAGTIVGGVLTLKRKQLAHQVYHLKNLGKAVKTVVVEHPVRAAWTLVDAVGLMESTARWHRFRRGVPVGEQITLTITEEQIHEQTMALLHTPSSRLFAQIQGAGFSSSLTQALKQAAALQRAVEEIQRDLNENARRLDALEKEQARVHANLEAVSTDSTFHDRMMRKLDAQETAIETAQAEAKKLRLEQKNRRTQLASYLTRLNVE